jgi:sulfonate transport system substrate-binding protein
LTLKDVTVANLSPADAGAAFASGSIDAWSIWDPYFAIAEQNPDTRVLATAAGVADTNNFLLANGAYAKANAATLHTVIAALAEDAAWSQDHLDDSIKSIAEITGVSEAAVRTSITRPNVHFAIAPISDDMMRVQQKTADTFYNAGLIPKKLDVRALVWKSTPS